MSRCVVNVVTGTDKHYHRGQKRLREQVEKLGNCKILCWKDPLPSNWAKHKDVPYGFKVMALLEAAKEYDSVLWLDSFVVPIASMEPLWEQIEADGYFLVKKDEEINYEWTADSAYPELFPDMTLKEARKLNKTIPQAIGGVIGLNVTKIGGEILSEYKRLMDRGAFHGPWANANCPDRPKYNENDENHVTAPCGPQDVKGHRHDQSVISVIAYRLGLTLTKEPVPYAYMNPASGTIVLHDGPGVVALEEAEPIVQQPPQAQSYPSFITQICPSCKSTAVGMAGGMRRCNQCGYSF
jgi:hypothetical protein